MAKVRVLTDLRIEVDPPRHINWRRTLEDQAREMESWAREFEEFVRDHRSQDRISMNVIRDYEDQCSHCGSAWEVDANGPLCCGKAQEEWGANKAQEEIA